MTNKLHDTLSDLVRGVPEHVVRDDLADKAWAAGRRRRRRHRAAIVGATAAVLTVVGLNISPAAEWIRTVQPAGAQGEQVVDGYPQRVGHQWWVRKLPDRPGPMAGIFVRTPAEPSNSSRDEWIAVSETGRQWLIPTAQGEGANAPTLSSTGRYLGYFPHADRPPFVVHDLVSGERTVLRNIWPHVGDGHPNMVHAQTPAFWASDDNHVLLHAISGTPHDNLLLTPKGAMEHLHVDRFPAGWIGANRLAFLSYTERDDGGVTGATITVIDISGAVKMRVDLDLPRAFRHTFGGLSQWSAVTSPDGRSVAVRLEESSDQSVYQFSMQDGRLHSGPAYVKGAGGICPLGWRGDQPVVPTYPDEAGGALAVLAGAHPRAMVVAEPSLHARCLMLASHAAEGEPKGRFGTSTSWWSWWWREALLAGATVVTLVWALVRIAARRRRIPGDED